MNSHELAYLLKRAVDQDKLRTAELIRLRKRVEELEGLLGVTDIPSKSVHGLTPRALQLLGLLLKREFIGHETGRVAMSGYGGDTMSKTYVGVYVNTIRKWLGDERGLLQNKYAEGFFIAPKDKPRVRQLIEERKR